MKMKPICTLLVAVVLSRVCSAQPAGPPALPNPGFEETTVRPADDPELLKLMKLGWKFTAPIDWPVGWRPMEVSNVTAAISREKPHAGQKCLLLWGESGSSGYIGATVSGLRNATYKVSFYGRGKGRATLMTPGVHVVLSRQMTDEWTRYSGIFKNPTGTGETTVTLQAQGAPTWFDDLAIEECDALEALRIREEALLSSKGLLLAAGAPVDQTAFTANINAVAQAVPRLTTLMEADPIPANMAALELLKTRAAALKLSLGPTVDEMNASLCYKSIAEKLLKDLEFVEAEDQQ